MAAKARPAKKSAATTRANRAAKPAPARKVAKPAPARRVARPARKVATPARKARAPAKPAPPLGPVLRAIRSVIYQVDDLARAKAFYSAALGRSPYFDEPFYVGYDVDGQELGLHPDVATRGPGPGGAVAYWKVDDLRKSCDLLLALGGRAVELPHGVGGGIETAIVGDPFGNLVGLIQFS